MATLLAVTTLTTAIVLHALAVPIIFTAVARHYFRADGAGEPLPTAFAFAATVAVLDLAVVAGLIQRSPAMMGSVTGFWLPLLLIFFATWATGALMSTMPWDGRATSPARP